MTSKIKSFYENQTVLLTGGTGFLGKVVMEKLLRACEGIKKIHIIIRSKNNKTPEERLEGLLKIECFDSLRSTNPDLLSKISLLNGDCCKPNLGLSEQDVSTLLKETTCFIYAAANVRFDQTLKEASRNIKAVRDALELAKQMPNLKVFVFISTLYSNCCYQHVKEEFYPSPLGADTLFSLVEDLDDDTLIAVTPILISNWPNTYVYSKSISEDLVRNAGQHIPITIVRPAIIMPSFQEPIKGWVDSYNGALGGIVATSLGLLRIANIKSKVATQFVPVDYVSNCILAAAWKRDLCSSSTIYNYSGHNKNLLTWKKYRNITSNLKDHVQTSKMLWYPKYQFIENRTWYRVCSFFLHTLPAYLIEFILICLRKSPKAVKEYQRFKKLLDSMVYFSTKSWNIDHDNVTDLWKEMNSEDKKLFNFDMEYIDWSNYLLIFLRGGRFYLLKDPIETLPQALRKEKLLFIAHYTVIALFWYLVYKLSVLIISLFI